MYAWLELFERSSEYRRVWTGRQVVEERGAVAVAVASPLSDLLPGWGIRPGVAVGAGGDLPLLLAPAALAAAESAAWAAVGVSELGGLAAAQERSGSGHRPGGERPGAARRPGARRAAGGRDRGGRRPARPAGTDGVLVGVAGRLELSAEPAFLHPPGRPGRLRDDRERGRHRRLPGRFCVRSSPVAAVFLLRPRSSGCSPRAAGGGSVRPCRRPATSALCAQGALSQESDFSPRQDRLAEIALSNYCANRSDATF